MNWFWISPEDAPSFQRSALHCGEQPPPGQHPLAILEASGHIEYPTPPTRARIRVCADVAYALSLNGQLLAIGPAAVGNDFLYYPEYPGAFFDEFTLDIPPPPPESSEPTTVSFAFSLLIRGAPRRGTEYSSTFNGFAFEATFAFPDGSTHTFAPDASWRARMRPDYLEEGLYNGRLAPGPWCPLIPLPDRWHAAPSAIPICELHRVLPSQHAQVTVPDGALFTYDAPFDEIHAAYPCIRANAPCRVTLALYEKDPSHPHATEEVILDPGAGHASWVCPTLHSVGGILYTIHDIAPDLPVTVQVAAIDSAYPTPSEGSFSCSDDGLTEVYALCKRTLRTCRQTTHLDSPKHQEPLACTGDYYIEALMTAFTYGDMRLAAFDLLRTARFLVANQGRMFHTTYSLLWVLMLREVYSFTADLSLLQSCLPALHILLDRFRSYLGPSGLLENPPDYMFVDWVVSEGFSLHHPPKALGQSTLNAFYFGALLAAADIADTLASPDFSASSLRAQAATLRTACNTHLYDPHRRLYIDGLATPDPGLPPWRPANPTHLRHFSRYPNVLAALFGLCPDSDPPPDLLRRTLTSSLPEVQPYFMHFVLEAIHHTHLTHEFTLPILRQWIPLAHECPKGLKEGWFAPEPNYAFDYSHAWGGTPAYQLPARLLGFQMLAPGFKHISLSPNLFGLAWANIAIPTPYGILSAQLRENQAPILSIPKGLHVTLHTHPS